ncbi:hypothetical protein, partial [Kluyvera sp. Awk 3]
MTLLFYRPCTPSFIHNRILAYWLYTSDKPLVHFIFAGIEGYTLPATVLKDCLGHMTFVVKCWTFLHSAKLLSARGSITDGDKGCKSKARSYESAYPSLTGILLLRMFTGTIHGDGSFDNEWVKMPHNHYPTPEFL